MFNKITLKNYRTHKLTTLELQPITLLIGNNNSGKTNFLSGIQHFSGLARLGNLFKELKPEDRTVRAKDYFPHRYRLADDDDAMSIEIEWSKNNGFVKYEMELYKNEKFAENVACREKLELRSDSSVENFDNGYKAETNLIELRSQLPNYQNFEPEKKELLNSFFRDFTHTFSYHLQSSFLKGFANGKIEFNDLEKRDEEISIPANLGYECGNLQQLIYYVKNHDERVFSRFLTLMRRFGHNKNFQGIRYDREKSQLLWEFDLGRTRSDRLVDEFPPDVISDGLMKAAAIALLVSLQRPPALVLIEEIENSIDPGNFQELIHWLWQATAPNQKEITPQFILTSHSPSVLREFHENLDSVYIFRSNIRNQSHVKNLCQALDILMGIGTLEAEMIEDEKNGKRFIEIPKYRLVELWYSGTIG